ncbi:MAG: TRAP transporter substrate-binding protein [Firmicutes bacterium]|nr:TRAP transporter substrate-binding protein [Bacillota bacterium]
MKRFFLFLLLVLLLGNAVVFSAGTPIQMKFAHYAAPGHPADLAAKRFAEAVEKRTKGAIKVIIYPNSELGSPPEILEQNILGAVDMSLPTQGALDKYSKKFAVVMLPFIYQGYPHVYKVLDGPFMKWAGPDLEKQGLIFLSNWDYGFRHITNNVRPINSPDDLKGLKMRTPPEIQLQATMEALGAVVTKIAFNELYMALKQGGVDGEENPIAVIYYNKLYEVQKYLALTGHVYNCMVHVMSKKVWDRLSRSQRRIIQEESTAAGAYMRQLIQSEEDDLVKKLQELGMIVTRPNIAEFKARMGPAYKRIDEYAGSGYVDKYLKMVESVPVK